MHTVGFWYALLVGLMTSVLAADSSKETSKVDVATSMREGLKEYAAQKFDEAQKAFASAASKLESEKSDKASIAAYDEACALHRKGDFDKASNRYLDAGMSRDRSIAVAAHFNLGMLSAEEARTIAGDQPEQLPEEKRKETVESLSKAVAAYRHCLELDPNHGPSRRNLELIRQWIKHYTDRWADLDRQKRRQEANLVQFVDFLSQQQSSLLRATEEMDNHTSSDRIFEWKQLQDDLADEIPYLKEKIDSELKGEAKDPSSNDAASASDDQLEKGIQILKEWSDESQKHMEKASQHLERREKNRSTTEQTAALERLDRIWDAIVDFSSLLSREIQTQSQVEDGLKSDEETNTEVSLSDKEFRDVSQLQESTLRRARLLAPKAEAMLQQIESQPAEQMQEPAEPLESNSPSDAGESPKPPSPEEIKAGLQKAIELAPSAVESMEQAVSNLKKREFSDAHRHAAEAKRILLEIQDSQPKQPKQNQDQQNQDKQQQNQSEQDQEKQENQKQQSEPKDSKEQEKDASKDDPQKEKGEQERKQPEVSKDRIADVLRRVREREQEKRERDKELKAKILGRVPVEKDW